jgi:mono/diheme cytochrome c family protein
VPLALTGYQLGLLVVALVFVAFALVVALAVPRWRPDFPGKGLGAFLGICLLLFLAQMTAVFLLAEKGEADEPAVEGTEDTETTPTETTPTETTETTGTETTETTETTDTTETETTGTTETETTETTEATEAQGDPVAGKEVFLTVASPQCGGCHTLADAGTTGSIGPNLDDTSPSYDKAVERVTQGAGVMPSFADSLTEEQIQDVAAYVSSAATG